VGPAVLGEPALLLLYLGQKLRHLLLQVNVVPGQPRIEWVSPGVQYNEISCIKFR
jgi:hypothetical protein